MWSVGQLLSRSSKSWVTWNEGQSFGKSSESGEAWVNYSLGPVSHGSCGTRVNCLVGRVCHGSCKLGSITQWVKWVMVHVERGSTAVTVTRIMGHNKYNKAGKKTMSDVNLSGRRRAPVPNNAECSKPIGLRVTLTHRCCWPKLSVR